MNLTPPYPISRANVDRAIRSAAASPNGKGIVLIEAKNALNVIAIDSVLMLLREVELKRDELREKNIEEDLHQIVEERVNFLCTALNLGSGRAKAYRQSIMQFYRDRREFMRLQRKDHPVPPRVKQRPRRPRPATILVLEG